MADLEDLNYTSISNMNTDEAIEALRQIRLSRRIPLKTKRTKTTRKVKIKTNVTPQGMNAEQIAELLKTLGG